MFISAPVSIGNCISVGHWQSFWWGWNEFTNFRSPITWFWVFELNLQWYQHIPSGRRFLELRCLRDLNRERRDSRLDKFPEWIFRLTTTWKYSCWGSVILHRHTAYLHYFGHLGIEVRKYWNAVYRGRGACRVACPRHSRCYCYSVYLEPGNSTFEPGVITLGNTRWHW